jgi:hypothetical protein
MNLTILISNWKANLSRRSPKEATQTLRQACWNLEDVRSVRLTPLLSSSMFSINNNNNINNKSLLKSLSYKYFLSIGNEINGHNYITNRSGNILDYKSEYTISIVRNKGDVDFQKRHPQLFSHEKPSAEQGIKPRTSRSLLCYRLRHINIHRIPHICAPSREISCRFMIWFS